MKQTLLEIASGLGTPLSINESTLHRRFGIFARVLIDVNLAEKLFESFVIELDDHALSILVQYEKHPDYCVHCKMLGHSIQTCSKLKTVDNIDRPGMHAKPVSDGNMTKIGRKSKTNVAGNFLSGNEAKAKALDSSNRKDKNLQATPRHIEAVREFEEGNISQHDVETHVADKPSTPILTLLNSFDLLEEDDHFVAGEAKSVDGDTPLLTVEDVVKINCMVMKDPIEKDEWIHHRDSESLGKFDDGPSKSMACSPGIPTSLVHSSTLGRMDFPKATAVSFDLALDPDLTEAPILQPIITPITTTDEILGPDKGKVQLFDGTKQATAASIKSTKILSKFWGDEQDTNNETNNDSQMANSENITPFPANALYTSRKGKRGRPKKQKSPNKALNDSDYRHTSSQGTNKDSVNTKSKTGSQTPNNNIVFQ